MVREALREGSQMTTPTSKTSVLWIAQRAADEPGQGNGLLYLGRDMPLRDREWLIDERMPMRNVTLLSGDGGVGKTIALMQLSAATVLGKDWLGMRPAVGPLFDAGLRVLSFAGADALLGNEPQRGETRRRGPQPC
jgi:AAA domain